MTLWVTWWDVNTYDPSTGFLGSRGFLALHYSLVTASWKVAVPHHLSPLLSLRAVHGGLGYFHQEGITGFWAHFCLKILRPTSARLSPIPKLSSW